MTIGTSRRRRFVTNNDEGCGKEHNRPASNGEICVSRGLVLRLVKGVHDVHCLCIGGLSKAMKKMAWRRLRCLSLICASGSGALEPSSAQWYIGGRWRLAFLLSGREMRVLSRAYIKFLPSQWDVSRRSHAAGRRVVGEGLSRWRHSRRREATYEDAGHSASFRVWKWTFPIRMSVSCGLSSTGRSSSGSGKRTSHIQEDVTFFLSDNHVAATRTRP